jgi:hypothetical protein
MHRPPKSVLVAGVLFLVSAVYGLITGSLGLELFSCHASRTVVVLVALVHVYLGLGLWSGDNFARCAALWALGAGLLASFATMFELIHGHAWSVNSIAPHVINVAAVTFFAWHLSGSGALAHSGAGHGEHGEHSEHAH